MFKMVENCNQPGDQTDQNEQDCEGQQEKRFLHHAIRIYRASDQVESDHAGGCKY